MILRFQEVFAVKTASSSVVILFPVKPQATLKAVKRYDCYVSLTYCVIYWKEMKHKRCSKGPLFQDILNYFIMQNAEIGIDLFQKCKMFSLVEKVASLRLFKSY